jgi:hypothetical protein
VGLCECPSCLYGREGEAIIKQHKATIKRLQQERDEARFTLRQVVQECRAWKNRSNMMAMCAIKGAKERKEADAALEALRTAQVAPLSPELRQVTHACANCEQMARERDEARAIADRFRARLSDANRFRYQLRADGQKLAEEKAG